MTHSRRTALTASICAATLAFGALAGCSSSGGTAGTGKLSTADFITQADMLCDNTVQQLKAVKQPTSLTDYADIIKYDDLLRTAFPKFNDTMTKLVDRSPDAAALHKNWLDPELASFNAERPLAVKFEAAARAKNASELTAVAAQLAALPDHSSTEATYLTTYGLPDCATLANSGNN